MQLLIERRRGLVACAICIAAVIACVRGFFSPVVPELPTHAQPASPRLAKRVLWIVVDGLRYDTAFETGWMPELGALAKRGATGEASTTAITMTGVGVRAMATGMSPSLADLARNWSLPPVEEDNLFARIKARGERAVAIGNETWFQLFPDALARVTTSKPGLIKFARPVNGYDRQITKHVRELASDPSWELAVVHFGGVDNASHMWTPWDDRFEAKIREIDTDLGRIVSKMGPETTVIVTSDHGTSDRGHHGGIDPVERRTPLVMVGPGIRRGARLDVHQVDLPATIAVLMGIPVPAPVEGRAIAHALDLDAAQTAALIASERARHLRYATAYAEQFSVEPRPPDVELSDWLASVRARWLIPLVWAFAMIAASAWLFGLGRIDDRWWSLGAIAAAAGSLVAPLPSALVALAALLGPLVPWLREVRVVPTTFAVIALGIAQATALLVHTYERVINSAFKRELAIDPKWIGIAALAACAPFVWRASRAERVAPWIAFALLLAFAMPGDDAALRGIVVIGAVAAAASWQRNDGWSLAVAVAIAVAGYWIGPHARYAQLEVVAPFAIASAAAIVDATPRRWLWLVPGVLASATVATGRPAIAVFALIAIGAIAAVVWRGRLAQLGWGAAILLGMLTQGHDVPALIGLVVVCDRVGRLGKLHAFATIAICLALRDAFALVFEGKLAFGNLEIWLGYVAGNEHTVLGALLVFVKFLLPFVVVIALVTRSLACDQRSLAITGCIVFFVLRLAEIVIGLCTAQGTFYGPYRDVAQLAIVAAMLITLLLASVLARSPRGGSAETRGVCV